MEGKGKDYKNKFHSKPRNLISTLHATLQLQAKQTRVLKQHYFRLYMAPKIKSSLAFYIYNIQRLCLRISDKGSMTFVLELISNPCLTLV